MSSRIASMKDFPPRFFEDALQDLAIQNLHFFRAAEIARMLVEAASSGNAKAVSILLPRTEDPGTSGGVALRVAAWNEHVEVVKELLKYKYCSCKDLSLVIASEFGFTEIVKLLLEAGANPHYYEDFALKRALEKNHTEIVELLKEAVMKKG